MLPSAGFVGLGDIGRPVARCLVGGGVPLTVFNRTRAHTDELAAAGAQVAASLRDVVERSEVVVTCLSGPAADDEVYRAAGGLLDGPVEGRIFVNLATVGPEAARRLAADVVDRGAGYVDAPLLGGHRAAVACALVLAVGGAAEHVEGARPVLEPCASRIVHIGEPGLPQLVKLLNNLLYAITTVGLADVVRLATTAGIDPVVFEELLRAGSARAFTVDVNLRAMLERRTAPRGTLGMITKDVELAVEATRELGGVGAVGIAAATALRHAVASGLGELDVPALVLSTAPPAEAEA